MPHRCGPTSDGGPKQESNAFMARRAHFATMRTEEQAGKTLLLFRIAKLGVEPQGSMQSLVVACTHAPMLMSWIVAGNRSARQQTG
ncbi:hypothetical protein FBX97_1890 [Herbaspirillum sp. SJZ107]|nr:hypothetical protein FBX97_1890 [Herbaspirillum sp. SJZ107]